jgi:hypothetical protein
MSGIDRLTLGRTFLSGGVLSITAALGGFATCERPRNPPASVSRCAGTRTPRSRTAWRGPQASSGVLQVPNEESWPVLKLSQSPPPGSRLPLASATPAARPRDVRGTGATVRSGADTEKVLPVPGEFPGSRKSRSWNFRDRWPQRLGTRTAQATAQFMGPRHCTLVSSAAAGLSVLIPGPSTMTESGPAPRHPGDLEVEAIGGAREVGPDLREDPRGRRRLHANGHVAGAPLGHQPVARGHRRRHAGDVGPVTPPRPPGMSLLFAHPPLSDAAESAHEPAPGAVPG